jgi:uncharacterized protein YyaL (SSP411 family)
LPNLNVLSVVDPTLTGPESTLLATAKAKMLAARARRVRPACDDKVLASWNGLMLGSMARASAVLAEATYRAAAEKNLAFLKASLWDARRKTLWHRWREGEHDNVELLEGYAFLLAGVIELYEVTLAAEHLEFALALAETMLARFYDEENGGFWQGAPQAKDLILRVKEDYDGAAPSGNSVAIFVLLKLGAITGRKEFTHAAEKSLRLFASRLQQVPQAVPCLLQALDFSLKEPQRAVVVGDPRSSETRTLLTAIHTVHQPCKVVLGHTGPVEPFARTLPSEGGPVVYLCTGTACQPPTAGPARIKELLRQ